MKLKCEHVPCRLEWSWSPKLISNVIVVRLFCKQVFMKMIIKFMCELLLIHFKCEHINFLLHPRLLQNWWAKVDDVSAVRMSYMLARPEICINVTYEALPVWWKETKLNTVWKSEHHWWHTQRTTNVNEMHTLQKNLESYAQSVFNFIGKIQIAWKMKPRLLEQHNKYTQTVSNAMKVWHDACGWQRRSSWKAHAKRPKHDRKWRTLHRSCNLDHHKSDAQNSRNMI